MSRIIVPYQGHLHDWARWLPSPLPSLPPAVDIVVAIPPTMTAPMSAVITGVRRFRLQLLERTGAVAGGIVTGRPAEFLGQIYLASAGHFRHLARELAGQWRDMAVLRLVGRRRSAGRPKLQPQSRHVVAAAAAPDALPFCLRVFEGLEAPLFDLSERAAPPRDVEQPVFIMALLMLAMMKMKKLQIIPAAQTRS